MIGFPDKLECEKLDDFLKTKGYRSVYHAGQIIRDQITEDILDGKKPMNWMGYWVMKVSPLKEAPNYTVLCILMEKYFRELGWVNFNGIHYPNMETYSLLNP